MIDHYTISQATINDVQKLLQLINTAYRGEEAKKGWAHEADLINGSIRTNTESLTSLLHKKNAAILKCVKEHGELSGCVYLEKQNEKLYLGMLTVAPQLKGAGIGKQLLKASEQFAQKKSCRFIIMHVIEQRHTLIAWYIRHGYQDTGKKIPFPSDHLFGTPTQPLQFSVLEKIL